LAVNKPLQSNIRIVQSSEAEQTYALSKDQDLHKAEAHNKNNNHSVTSSQKSRIAATEGSLHIGDTEGVTKECFDVLASFPIEYSDRLVRTSSCKH